MSGPFVGLYFLATLIGVIVVIFWSAKNDQAGLEDETEGLLAMEDVGLADDDKGPVRQTRPGLRPRQRRPVADQS